MSEGAVVAEAGGVGEGGRIVGILTSPGRTLADVVRRPTWILPLVIIAVVAAATNFLLYEPVIIPMQMDRIEQNPNVTPEQAQRMEDQMASPVARAIGTAAPVIVIPLIILLQAGLVMLVGSIILGGESSFRTVFSVCAWTGLIYAVGSIIQAPLYALVTHRMEPVASLAFVLPNESPSAIVRFLRGVLGGIDVFQLWQLTVLSMGVALAYKRPRSFGVTCAAALWVVGAIIAGVSSVFAGRPQ